MDRNVKDILYQITGDIVKDFELESKAGRQAVISLATTTPKDRFDG